MALVTTVGGTTSNSYADAAFAVAHFALVDRVAAWGAYETSQQEALLLRAMLLIEAQDYIGSRAEVGQALQWPRLGGGRRDRFLMQTIVAGLYDRRGRLWPSTSIPEPIKRAQCEMALSLSADTAWLSDSDDVSLIRTGVVTIEETGGQGSSSRLPKEVGYYLDGFLLTAGSVRRLMKA